MTEREKLIEKLNKIWDVENMLKEFGETLPEFCKVYLQAIQEQADFILADRKAVLERVNKALTQLHEEAHDGIKDDYCYIHEIDAAFSEIDLAVKTMER